MMFKITLEATLVFFIMLFVNITVSAQSVSISVIPKPAAIKVNSGTFALNAETGITFDGDKAGVENVVIYFQEKVREIAALSLQTRSKGKNIYFNLNRNDIPRYGGYKLIITKDRVTITAGDCAGLFYGVQTFLQLIPVEHYGKKSKAIHLPCVEITDQPRFQWRGMMLDVSRHFFPKQFIFDFLDYMALHKMNVFHWHLVDNGGWRIEIDKYPLLTEKAAWRIADRPGMWNSSNLRPWQGNDDDRYGGFYTKADIREIVQYAADRFITIVPEIEMPGHSNATLYAYPELLCEHADSVNEAYGNSGVYCAGKEETFTFLQDIIDEVIELFPGKYVHIGGDEVPKNFWQKCPDCQKRIKTERLKDENELQSYFIRRIEKYLNSRGKKLIGWDEILEGGLAPDATVMSWRGMEGGIEAAKQGHDVVMSPTSHCYFDYCQSISRFESPLFGGYLPLSQVYRFEPVPSGLDDEEATHVLGCQANLWTEYVPTPQQAEIMIMPRMAALSEVAWSPGNQRDWDSFKQRMNAQFHRYDFYGIHYSKSVYFVLDKPLGDVTRENLTVELYSEFANSDIRYTVDGSEPTPGSARYSRPIEITKTTTIKAAAFSDGEQLGPMYDETFFKHKAVGKPVTLTHPYSPRYPGRGENNLVDGVVASVFHTDGKWNGFEEDDFEAVIDMGETIPVQHISIGFLQLNRSWIFLPLYVQFFVSADSVNFEQVAVRMAELPTPENPVKVEYFSTTLPDNIDVRFIKIYAKNMGRCPTWHPGAGGKAWLFADEVIVE